ncbi:MAG: hypothetical protein U9R15_02945 [Chloroflexota bacterium]|nr:hypothetical protein [Chloroflexota bacterium]
MNIVNRILIVILLLVVMVLCNILLVAPGAIDAVALQSAALADFFAAFQPWARVGLGVLFALALDIVLGLFIILEVRRPKRRAIRVEKAAGGEVQVSINSIADRLSHEIDRLPDVLRVKSKVGAKRGGVVIELDVETVAGIDVPEKAALIVEHAQQVIEEQMGLKLSKPPQVNLRSAPYSKTPPLPVSPKVREKPPVVSHPDEPEEELPVLAV